MYGPTHPGTLGVMNNITTTLHSLGRKKEAVNMMEQAMVMVENQGWLSLLVLVLWRI